MKKIFSLLLISCITMLLMPLKLLADNSSSTTAAANKNVSFLFVQSADKATLNAVSNQAGTYTLVLQKAHPYITYFSDRPYRKVGLLTPKQYLNMWQSGANNFKNNAPNADISAIQHVGLLHKHIAVNFPVQLTAVNYDKQAHTFIYTVHLLPGGSPIPDNAKFGYIAMIIDGGTCTCCISGTCIF